MKKQPDIKLASQKDISEHLHSKVKPLNKCTCILQTYNVRLWLTINVYRLRTHVHESFFNIYAVNIRFIHQLNVFQSTSTPTAYAKEPHSDQDVKTKPLKGPCLGKSTERA